MWWQRVFVGDDAQHRPNSKPIGEDTMSSSAGCEWELLLVLCYWLLLSKEKSEVKSKLTDERL